MNTTVPLKWRLSRALCRPRRRAAVSLLALATCALAVTLVFSGAAGAAYPGSNGKIAFASYRDGDYSIYVMNADGSGQTKLTHSTDWETEPEFSPDGSKIAYTRGATTGANDIWVMNADGTGQTNLTPGAGQEGQSAWSPDGSKIAFASTRDGNWEVYVMNADGSEPTNLSRHGGEPGLSEDRDPTWSPDGSKIAFFSYRDGNGEIYLMNPDGSGQTNLTQTPAFDLQPAWSPDSSKIAFTILGGPNSNEVYVMNADGTGQTALTKHAAADQDPSWSPDGSKIAFMSSRDGEAEVYVMNADGSTQTNLSQFASHDTDPSWQTVASADLALSLVASPEEAKVQKPLTYTIRVDNVGPSNAAGVVVTDDLPAEQRFVSAAPSQGSCQTPPVGTNGTVTCNLGFLLREHNATAEVVVRVLAQRKSSVSNTATVTSSTPDPYMANNSATITTPVK